MAMMLKPPPGGAWHEVEEVVRRLRIEFARVETTSEGVSSYAANLARDDARAGHADRAARVASIIDKGLAVIVMDGPPASSFVLMVLPNIPIMAGFNSVEHLEAIQPLLSRCARALSDDLK